MSALTNAERAVLIVNSGRKTNHPRNDNERVVGFVVGEEIAGLSDALFALEHITKAVSSYDVLVTALQKIEKWFGEFPETGQFWDEEQERPMSYAACFGSNGERDFMRNIAHDALLAAQAHGGQS